MRRAYAGMTDEFYVIHTGGKPFYNQRCPRCHVWAKGTAPSSRCSKCQAALPHHLRPLAHEAEAPGPEYGTISPDMNRPGMSGDSTSWGVWSHVRWFVEEVSAGAA